MVINLCSKEKVVRKTGWILLFLGAFHVTSAQPLTLLSGNAITLRCKDCNFEEILRRLEQESGLHFIYSSSIVPLNTQLSIDYQNKPVDEVLQALGNSTRLAFLRKGQHVVIKPVKLPAATTMTRKPVPGAVTFGPEEKFATSARMPNYHKEQPITTSADVEVRPVLGEVVMKKPPALPGEYFDTSKYSLLPTRYVHSLNLKNTHRGWFISGGLVLNDYSAGVELRGGLRSAYLTFRPAMLNDGQYGLSYGIGTSMPLQYNLSLNTIYSFASLKGDYSRSGGIRQRLPVDVGILARHHQVRVRLEYSVSSKVSLHAGVSVNMLEIRYDINETGYVVGEQAGMPAFHAVSSGAPKSYQRIVVGRTLVTHRPNSPVKMWMGWETSVSYKLNFFQRRKSAN